MQAAGGNWFCLALRMLLTAFNPEILIINTRKHIDNIKTY